MNNEFTLLLINPWVYDFALFDLYLKPLGLLYLSSILKKFGFNVIIIDCLNRYDEYFIKNKIIFDKKYGTGKFFYEVIKKPEILKFVPRHYKRYGLPYDEVEKRLNEIKKEFKIKAILITSIMTYWYPGVFEMIKLVKKFFRNTPVILGGIYPSLLEEHAKKFSGADFILTGNNLKSILEKIFEIIKYTPKDRLPENFNEWEEPDFSIYGNYLKYLVVLTSLGCPLKCTYCSTPILHPVFQRKEPEKIIKNVLKYKPENIAFYDDALLFNFNNLKKFLFYIKENNLKINFHTPNGLHIKFINQEIADTLFQFNFKTIRLSFETSNIQRQFETGGKTSTEDLKRAIGYLKNAGYSQKEIEVYLLVGFPDQTKEEVIESISTVKELGAVPKIVEFSPIPNTPEYKKIFGQRFIDPLLHNNSVFYIRYSRLSIDDMIYFRDLAKSLI